MINTLNTISFTTI